jgi:hypothetical protein
MSIMHPDYDAKALYMAIAFFGTIGAVVAGCDDTAFAVAAWRFSF